MKSGRKTKKFLPFNKFQFEVYSRLKINSRKFSIYLFLYYTFETRTKVETFAKYRTFFATLTFSS
uniref:Uncharacterized protein n=1 Tax=Tetranychus urticae TaxID=32264 RepID=T1KDX0_TETUR